jgi:hypothetical protein
VLWQISMKRLSSASARGQLRYFAGFKAVKVTSSLSTIQGIRGSGGKTTLILNFETNYRYMSSFVNYII